MRYQGASGAQHKGLDEDDVVNMPYEIYLACTTGGHVDGAMYEALHSTIDYDGLWDILEMNHIHQSWEHAALINQAEDADG